MAIFRKSIRACLHMNLKFIQHESVFHARMQIFDLFWFLSKSFPQFLYIAKNNWNISKHFGTTTKKNNLIGNYVRALFESCLISPNPEFGFRLFGIKYQAIYWSRFIQNWIEKVNIMVETLRSNEFNGNIGGSQSIGSHAPQTPMDACFFIWYNQMLKLIRICLEQLK